MVALGLRCQQLLVWAFAALATVYTVALVVLLEFWPPTPPTLPGPDVLKIYAEDNIRFRIGVVLMVVSGAFYLCMSIVIAAQMARLEKGFPVLAALQLCNGVLGTWLFAFPPVVWGVAAFVVSHAPEMTVVLHQAGWIILITPASYFALQVIPIAIIALAPTEEPYSAFPRWMGYLTIWVGFVGTPAAMGLVIKTGPFAWDGVITIYIPLVAFAIWLSSLVYCLNSAIRAQIKDEKSKAGYSTNRYPAEGEACSKP